MTQAPCEIEVEVSARRMLTPRIAEFTLRAAGGGPLPPWEAGAHVRVDPGAPPLRSYSLCGPPGSAAYVIAVQREDAGGGGSRAVHERLVPGARLRVSAPQNAFPLVDPGRTRSLLIAGGIGITPLLAMLYRLEALGSDYTLHVLTRSRDETAYADVLTDPARRGRVHLWHDGGVPGQGADLAAILRPTAPDLHLYGCGPEGLLSALRAGAAHWPRGHVHFESFAHPDAPAAPAGAAPEFEVELARSGRLVGVPAGVSILDALLAAGVAVDSSCGAGTCGTCQTRYLSGEVDHRDYVLMEEDTADQILICVSRARPGTRLVLDL